MENMSERLARSAYSKINYKNKDREKDIKKDVKDEFSKIEKNHLKDFKIIRDDQEIWEAGMNIIDRYILQLKYSKGLRVNNEKFGVKDGKATLITSENVYKKEALIYFIKARNNLVNKHNAVKNAKITSSEYNRQLINEIAYDIDKAENDALKKIELKLNPKQEQKNAIEQSSVVRDKQGNIKIKNGQIERQKPMFTQDKKGILTFTDRSNPLKIHDALKGLFPKGKNYKYKIDYNKCTKPSIKNTIKQLTGTGQCWISYDESSKTYLLRDKGGVPIKHRALIWEGVTLQRDELIQWNTYEEEEKRKESIGKVEASAKSVITPENDPKLKEMVGDIPDSLKKKLEELGNEDYRRFIIETEKRLGAILRYGKQYGYELHTNPVSKLQVSSGLMEIHFINGDTEPDVKVWENSSDSKIENAGKYILGENLYNMLDGNEGDYLTYLTARVKKLWGGKFDELTVKDDLLEVKPNYNLQNSERLPEQTVGTLNYGIQILRRFIENHRESEGDSRADNDDRYLVSMKKELDNLEYTLEHRRETTKKQDMLAIVNKSIDKLADNWIGYRGTVVREIEIPKIREVLLGATKEDQIKGIRDMAKGKRINGDVTESSFLAEEIEGNDDLGVKDQEVQKCIDNIKSRTTMSIYNKDGSINQKVKGRYDNTYASAKKGTDSLITLFVGRGWLPKNWKKEEKEVRKCMDNLRDKLNSINDQCNNISLSIDNMIKEQHQKRLKLEQKDNKTEDEIKTLQGLVYLEEHPNEQKAIYKETIEKTNTELKYGNLGQVVKGGLMSALGELGGGVTGKNADIYNDIKGYGRFNLSDENAKIAGEIITEIAITVAVAVVTGGVGGVAMATALRGAAFAARGAKWVNLANKIYKVVNISQKGYKGLSIGAKAVKLGYRGTSLLLEGTAFNAASNMIHSAMNGTSLDNLNLNPIAKENVQTAAFLGALSVGNQLAGTLMKAGGRTKVGINLAKGLEKAHLKAPAVRTTGVVTELGTMLGAEQVINVTFGHDVIDPETGEIHTERTLVAPTQEELCQTVGMILAFKMVKPGLWHKYEQKLNNGTLEICRSVKKNEVLIKNTKTGKVEKIQDIIDGKNNNYKPTPEQYRLRKHNRWREKQSKYELEILQAQEKIGELPESSRSEAMKKLLEAGDIVNLSPNDIKRIQREIGLIGKKADGIFDSKSLKRLQEYIQTKNGGKIIEEINILGNKWEQARTYEEKLKFLKENFHIDGLTRTEIESLTKDQINTLKELKDLGFSLSIGNISINLLKLKPEEINTLRQLKDLGVNIFSYTNKLSKLKPEEINTLRQLKDLGVDLSFDVKELSNFTPEQINTLKKVKELGVNLGYSALELSKLTSEQINTLKELKKLGIDISEVFPTFGRNLISYKSEELLKLKELKDLGINVNKNIDLEDINDKIMQTLKELKKLGFNIKEFDLSDFFDMAGLKGMYENINKIKKICNLGIKRNKNTLSNVWKIAESDINIIEKGIKNLDNALKIKENELELSIKELKKLEKNWFTSKKTKKINKLKIKIDNLENQINSIKDLKRNIGSIDLTDIGDPSFFIATMISQKNEIKDYHKRKKEFLEKNQTLEDSDFNELFKAEGSKAKYGMSEINQTSLGYCYAYTGFELLKKSNFFDVLIKTSMKKTNNGREVKLPLGDPNGHIVKVNCNGKKEIDSKYDFSEIDKNEPEETRRGEISINSKTSLGFKVLEIAFIKEYIINNRRYDGIDVIEKSREEYKNTGDITINEYLLHEIEGGLTTDFFEHLLPKDVIKTKSIENIEMKKVISKFVNIGNTKVNLSIHNNTGLKFIECETIDGKKMQIHTHHAYSIEKVYHDNIKNTDIIEFVNPWYTDRKYKITVDEACKIFNKRDITSINIGKIFQ